MCCFLCLIVIFSFVLSFSSLYLIVHNYLSFVSKLMFVADKIVVVVVVGFVIALVALYSFDDDVVVYHLMAMNDVTT